jgi:transcriptional regulator with XRE-family HTH domain
MKWLNTELEKRSWSRRELAKRANLSSGAVAHVLRGERGAGSDFCQAIAGALGIPVEDVYRRAGLLPRLEAGTEADPTIQRILDRLKYLTADERREALALVDVVYRRKHKGP